MPVFIGPERDYPKPDGKTTFDKLSSVFASGNATRDDAPNHIRIQEKVPLEVALMWQNMCPAQVYEVPDEELEAAKKGNGSIDGKHEVALNDHALELRAVRSHHREGRTPDTARGRRRPELPGHVGDTPVARRASREGGSVDCVSYRRITDDTP